MQMGFTKSMNVGDVGVVQLKYDKYTVYEIVKDWKKSLILISFIKNEPTYTSDIKHWTAQDVFKKNNLYLGEF